jgi:DNA-binding response OmpR family regulator
MMEHVLVIEDDEAVSQVICDHLAEHGYRCTTAGTVEEARLILAKFTIDLIIADIGLPGTTSGATLAEEAHRSGIPAMIVTGHRDVAEPPGIPVLYKPLRLATLLEMVETLLARRAAAATG